jgi:hypothetical protein
MHVQALFIPLAMLGVSGIGSLLAQQTAPATISASDVKPSVTNLTVSATAVTDLHLRPLFTTTIRLPEPVTSVAVGAPTLFEVEHSEDEPLLVFVKPSTKEAARSNLIIALQSGHEISMRLLSDGVVGTAPVDFVVNYEPRQSFLIGSTDAVGPDSPPAIPAQTAVSEIDQGLTTQSNVATPEWSETTGKALKIPSQKDAGKPILAALGNVVSRGDQMLVAYSELNTTDHWIEVLPPQVEMSSPNQKAHKSKNKKERVEILAEQVPITAYRLNMRRLAPGQRADGAVEFSRPGFKQGKDRLLLELATASAVDDPVLLQLPFVAPGK